VKRELERERERGVPCNWATDVKGHVEHNFLANLKIFLGLGLGLSVLCELGIAFRTRSAFFFYLFIYYYYFQDSGFYFLFSFLKIQAAMLGCVWWDRRGIVLLKRGVLGMGFGDCVREGMMWLWFCDQ
jgi:hypothetical protein